MANATQTSTDDSIDVETKVPAHNIGINVYLDDGRCIATGRGDDAAQGISTTVARAVRAYAIAVEDGEEVVTLE